MLADGRAGAEEGAAWGGAGAGLNAGRAPAQEADDLGGDAVLGRRGVARVPSKEVGEVDLSVPIGVHQLHKMLRLGLIHLGVPDGVWKGSKATGIGVKRGGTQTRHAGRWNEEKKLPARF